MISHTNEKNGGIPFMNDREIEIRIADLFAAVLKAAKPILCFALILALLGAGYGLRKANSSAWPKEPWRDTTRSNIPTPRRSTSTR